MAQFFKITHASYKWIYSLFPIIILYFLPELPFAHCSQLQSRAQVKNVVWLPSRGCYKLEWAWLSSRGQNTVVFQGLGYQKLVESMIAWFRKKREQNCPIQKKIDFQITKFYHEYAPWNIWDIFILKKKNIKSKSNLDSPLFYLVCCA